MKLVIFAGGIGTRLWPLSRQNSPKQFDQIFSGKSTLQLAVARLLSAFGLDNIYIQTVPQYQSIVRQQIPDLAVGNIFIEPARKNLAAAVCFTLLRFKQLGLDGPLAILWADHLMDRQEEFISALKISQRLVEQQGNRFVFLAEKPRFANNNLGWVKVGEKLGSLENKAYYAFGGWKYKPVVSECQRMYNSGEYYWNPGYFITSIGFLTDQYRKLAPEIYECVTSGSYSAAPASHFDQAIVEKLDLNQAVVIKTDMGWSDPGTLYALKEALAASQQDNVIAGRVVALSSQDCLLYNLEDKKLLTAVGLSGMVVVNTADAVIVVPKDEVVRVTQLVDKLKAEGLEEYL